MLVMANMLMFIYCAYHSVVDKNKNFSLSANYFSSLYNLGRRFGCLELENLTILPLPEKKKFVKLSDISY